MNQLSVSVQYVGFWARLFAFLVDSALLIAVLSPLMSLLGLDPTGAIEVTPERVVVGGISITPEGVKISESGGAGLMSAGWIQWLIAGAAVVAFWMWKSATPGKMILSAWIVDAKTLGKPGTGQLIGRYLGYFVSTLFLGLGFFWIAFDSRKQGWHDKIAHTVVVKKASLPAVAPVGPPQ